ncbi:MAG: site-specific DNA-methyltransferase [Bacteroidetes bacterium]|nr:site-specific DNA-methyltransferase [Bacteroidota bacterium]
MRNNNKNKNTLIDYGERGKYNLNNKLNDLTGKEWIKFSKSWFIHRPPRRKNNELLHPAKFPETLVEEFISFFTKEGDWVLDPFMGTGSALIAAGNLKRNGVGVELSKEYFNISKERFEKANLDNKIIPILGTSENIKEIISEKELSEVRFDYVITSPPYWNQLERNSLRQKVRSDKGLSTKYSQLENDLGNEKEYDKFIERQAKIFDQVFDLTKPNGYLTIIINNVYYKGKLFPLVFDTAISLTKRGDKSWILKDEKIWLQDDKPLVALGINSAWVSNRHHQYCLIFRKEIDLSKKPKIK